ncbi:hypothetical protein ACFSS8_05970 [Paracoccus kondratievae]
MQAFRDKTKGQMKAVLSESVQDVIEEAQRPIAQGGRMPVDTGNLRNSLISELNGVQIGTGATSYTLAAAGMEPGDIARFGWTAAYALRQELGFVGQDSLGRTYNQAGKHFVEGAADQWPQIVARNVERLK